jgi:hypothetical protein
LLLGLLLPPGPAGEPEAGTVLVVAPAGLLHPRVPQPDGSLVYPGSRLAIWSTQEPVTVFGAEKSVIGSEEVTRAFRWLATRFSIVLTNAGTK